MFGNDPRTDDLNIFCWLRSTSCLPSCGRFCSRRDYHKLVSHHFKIQMSGSWSQKKRWSWKHSSNSLELCSSDSRLESVDNFQGRKAEVPNPLMDFIHSLLTLCYFLNLWKHCPVFCSSSWCKSFINTTDKSSFFFRDTMKVAIFDVITFSGQYESIDLLYVFIIN